MHQWSVQLAYDTARGPKIRTESFYLPTEDDVRETVFKKGAYVLTIRRHERSAIERIMARSSWWQVQLLRGIQFRSTSTSPGVALWKIIQTETNPTRQNILAPAREALSRGLGVIDALKALKVFDHGTLAILSASETSNKLLEGIPHAIHSITQKRKNVRAIVGTMSWLAFDVVTIVQSLWWGKDMILGWFRENKPTDAEDLARYEAVVNDLELTWDLLLWFAFAMAAFLTWCIFSFWMNRGNTDWPTARLVRKIPLIGAYLRDLGFADSMSAAARMLRGSVPISTTLKQAAEASSMPDIANYWTLAEEDLRRGVNLGQALDRSPLSRAERLEIAGLSDLSQVATVMESISEMRSQSSKSRHSMIVWVALVFTGLYLMIAVGSAIYALNVMNMSIDSVMESVSQGVGG